VFVAELYLVTHRDLVQTARVCAVVDFLHCADAMGRAAMNLRRSADC
jgi:hypothetical protein